MGFGFSLIGFPILILLTIGLLVASAISKSKDFLKLLGAIWAFVFVILIVGGIMDHYRRPIRLTKDDIVGVYRVDADLYPGKNADWQYQHFKFEIKSDDRFIFTIKTDEGHSEKLYGKVIWTMGPPDGWTVVMDSASHHIIYEPPTLYRSHSRFYYVFNSKWGNMFFRKIEK